MPVRIYAFAKELGFDNKQLLDICDSAGIEDKGSALASLSDEEVAAIKNYLASPPPPPVEETIEPEEEFEEDETDDDDGSAEDATAQEEVVAGSDDGTDGTDGTEGAAEESTTADEPEAEDDKPAKPKSVVSGLLGKLRSRSKEVVPSVKATMGKPIVKKASIHDMVAKSKGGAQPQEKITPSTSKTPTRNPLFSRGQKVVRDLDLSLIHI